MRKTNLIYVFSIVSFAAVIAFASCASTKNISWKVGENDSADQEEMPFPFGDDVSARFTGTVYFNNMIQKD